MTHRPLFVLMSQDGKDRLAFFIEPYSHRRNSLTATSPRRFRGLKCKKQTKAPLNAGRSPSLLFFLFTITCSIHRRQGGPGECARETFEWMFHTHLPFRSLYQKEREFIHVTFFRFLRGNRIYILWRGYSAAFFGGSVTCFKTAYRWKYCVERN